MKTKVEQIFLRLKKDNLKINATLSAAFSSLGINPGKALTAISDLAKEDSSQYNIFYVSLVSYDDSSFEVKLKDRPDSLVLKNFLKKGYLTDDQLTTYAEATLAKSRALSLEKRILELKGILKSFTHG